MDEPASPGRRGTDHKTRRPHKKSRYGCTKCKERRIKCDELKPQCSRCKKMKLECHYPKRHADFQGLESDWLEPGDPPAMQLEVFDMDCKGLSSPESSEHSSGVAGSPFSSASSAPRRQSLLTLPEHRKPTHWSSRSQVSQVLTPVEFELFKHYLEHTSRDLTVDDDDQYTLQIGIPNLAYQSTPLMRSVLALAAVCKCCDIINQPSISHDDRERVLEFLSLAHDYHAQSLRDIQDTLPDAKHSGYDHVLANAAMMGMYGSGSHSVRIWLAKTATLGEQPLDDALPKYSQWISLFRAVHLAYTGLLDDTLRTDNKFAIKLVTRSSLQVQHEYRISSRVGHLRTPPDHVLHSILAATVGSALKQLRNKTQEVVAKAEADYGPGGHHDLYLPSSDVNPELQACLTALEIFTNIVTEAFAPDDPMTGTASCGNLAFEVDIDPVRRLSGVSPWLRRYTASITSMIPSRLPRRIIMAFIHKVPTSYLNLVEEMIGHIPAGAPRADESASSSSASMAAEPSLTHQLAVEIFAHWLVLVILLENVWWIGGIGAWELGRIVSFRKAANWPTFSLWNKDEDWWPESMFEVSRQFDKHRN